MISTRQLIFLVMMTNYCMGHLPRDALRTVGSIMVRLGLCVVVSGLGFYDILLWHNFLNGNYFSMNYVNVLDNYVDMQEKCNQNLKKNSESINKCPHVTSNMSDATYLY